VRLADSGDEPTLAASAQLPSGPGEIRSACSALIRRVVRWHCMLWHPCPALSRRLRWLAALAATGAGLGACGAGWHRVDSAPGPLCPRQQVQVWHEGRPERWHAVVLTADSVSGVPYLRSVACDSCRVRRSRAEVDSIRLGNPVAGFWKTAALVVAAPFVIVEVACAISGRYPDCWPVPE
jgi:hypothetical protein